MVAGNHFHNNGFFVSGLGIIFAEPDLADGNFDIVTDGVVKSKSTQIEKLALKDLSVFIRVLIDILKNFTQFLLVDELESISKRLLSLGSDSFGDQVKNLLLVGS